MKKKIHNLTTAQKINYSQIAVSLVKEGKMPIKRELGENFFQAVERVYKELTENHKEGTL